jgi:hypothetical protein
MIRQMNLLSMINGKVAPTKAFPGIGEGAG